MTPAHSRTPKYQRIAQAIFDEMAGQGLTLAKPQRTLATQFGVNRLTVQHALSWLEQQGKLERLPNQGYALCRQWQQAPAPATDTAAGRGKPKIGYPLWVDSFAQIDAFNTLGRMTLIGDLHSELERLGYELDIQCVGSVLSLQTDKIERLVREWDGLLLEPMEGESTLADDHPFRALFDRAVVIGVLNNWKHNCVCPDYYHGTELAVQTLLRSGVRHILYTGCEEETISHMFLRLVGLEKPINRTNAARKEVELSFANGGFHAAPVFSAVKRFFLSGGRCDAIVAGSPPAAMGAARALADLGIALPQQMQLIGISGSPALSYMVPRPTRVEATDPQALAREAARAVAERVRSGGKAQPTVMVPVQLVQGETTLHPSAASTALRSGTTGIIDTLGATGAAAQQRTRSSTR